MQYCNGYFEIKLNVLLIKCDFILVISANDRLHGLVVRLPGYRGRGPGFDSRRYQIFWVAVGLERGPLSPCEDKWRATWKESNGSGLENWYSRP
jgi:hypothetical protein